MIRKWRPPIAAIILLVMALALVMPVAAALLIVSSPAALMAHFAEHPGRAVAATLAVLVSVSAILYVTTRALAGPILELTERTRRIAAGDSHALKPLASNGSRELAEHADAFLAMAASLKVQNERMARFAVDVSHELRTPLTSIRGAAELLSDTGGDMPAAQRKRFLDNIAADAQRMTDITRGLMRLAESGRVSDISASCRLSQAIDAAGTLPLALAIDAPDDPAMAIAPSALASILTNMAENAAAHRATLLTVSTRAEGARIVVSIEDDGEGISPANAAQVFDPFFTTRRESGGTGLGLAIVRALVEAHGGSIAFIPSSQGARFEIALRLA